LDFENGFNQDLDSLVFLDLDFSIYVIRSTIQTYNPRYTPARALTPDFISSVFTS